MSAPAASQGLPQCSECESAVASVHCEQCSAHLCSPCSEAMHKLKVMKSHTPKPIQGAASTCAAHPSQSVTHFCAAHAAPCCAQCSAEGGAHAACSVDTVAAAAAKIRAQQAEMDDLACVMQAAEIAKMRATGGSASASASASSSSSGQAEGGMPQGSLILTSELAVPLKRFFGDTKIPTRLLYRASRDGYEGKDWQQRCVEQGPALTLVKVAGNGYVYGHYSAVSWPKPFGGDDTSVSDPSMRSFLFSLSNARNRPLRFRLHPDQADRSIKTYRDWGPIFGYDSNGALMYSGRAANSEGGCLDNGAASDRAYVMDVKCEEAAGLEAPSFRCEYGFFGGQREFPCADIEVYGL